MGWKDLIFDDSSSKGSVSRATEPARPPASRAYAAAAGSAAPVATKHESVRDSASFQMIAAKVLSRDSAYTRFLKQLGVLKKHIPDERAQYASALELLGTSGVTAEQIVQAIGSHAIALNGERTTFDTTIESELSTQVGGRRKEVEDIAVRLERNKTEVLRLQEESAQLEARRVEAQAAISIQEKKLAAMKEEFVKAYELLLGDLEADKAKIASIKA